MTGQPAVMYESQKILAEAGVTTNQGMFACRSALLRVWRPDGNPTCGVMDADDDDAEQIVGIVRLVTTIIAAANVDVW